MKAAECGAVFDGSLHNEPVDVLLLTVFIFKVKPSFNTKFHMSCLIKNNYHGGVAFC